MLVFRINHFFFYHALLKGCTERCSKVWYRGCTLRWWYIPIQRVWLVGTTHVHVSVVRSCSGTITPYKPLIVLPVHGGGSDLCSTSVINNLAPPEECKGKATNLQPLPHATIISIDSGESAENESCNTSACSRGKRKLVAGALSAAAPRSVRSPLSSPSFRTIEQLVLCSSGSSVLVPFVPTRQSVHCLSFVRPGPFRPVRPSVRVVPRGTRASGDPPL